MTHPRFPDFVPHPLLRNGHAQTIAGAYTRSTTIRYQAVQRLVELVDGDRIVLHDDRPASWQAGDRVALMLHGLAGSYRSPYLERIADKLNRIGVRTFRMDQRGCGAGFELAQFPGHAGRSEDAATALDAIRDVSPDSPITMIGFSMGGNIALKLLGEIGSASPPSLDSAVVVSPPIDLAQCTENLARGLNRLYDKKFTRTLLHHIRRRRRYSRPLASIKLTPRPKQLTDFDQLLTARLSGFADVWDYYRQASSAPLLPRIQLPTLIVTAADDPIIPVEIFQRADLSSSTDLLITQHGGHVAFIGAAGADQDRWWIDWRILQWIQHLGGNSSLA